MGKATAVAPSNIAFIKYWGIRDEAQVLPTNPSISMTLSACVSRCTVEHSEDFAGFEIRLRGEDGVLAPAPDAFAAGIERHLETLRRRAGRAGGFRVATENSFPSAAGIASSASGFAALATAASRAMGFDPSASELSVLARLSGSGSAARSVYGGYVEWPAAGGSGEATQLAPAEHWHLCDVVAIIDETPKEVSSREGHRRAPSSPYFERRLEVLPERLAAVRAALTERDFDRLGAVVEEEAIDLHLIALSSRPPIFYWQPGTLAVLAAVRELRADGVSVWATMDAGANVHLICPPDAETDVTERIGSLAAVRRLIRDRVGTGPEASSEHLF